MATNIGQQGYFSVLRWRPDATRDEARNVAVILVEAEGQFGGVKAAPVSSISPRLREQGILDAILAGLEKQFAAEIRPTVSELGRIHKSLQRSLYLTEPQPVAAPDPDVVLNALYRAYVSPRPGGSRAITKGAALDGVVSTLRRRGYEVRRGEYVQDFIFDLVIETQPQRFSVGEVLSFATSAKNWTPVEYDAGHFLYALGTLKARGFSVIQPPSGLSQQSALAAHQRVLRWFHGAGVPVLEPSEVAETELPVDGGKGA